MLSIDDPKLLFESLESRFLIGTCLLILHFLLFNLLGKILPLKLVLLLLLLHLVHEIVVDVEAVHPLLVRDLVLVHEFAGFEVFPILTLLLKLFLMLKLFEGVVRNPNVLNRIPVF